MRHIETSGNKGNTRNSALAVYANDQTLHELTPMDPLSLGLPHSCVIISMSASPDKIPGSCRISLQYRVDGVGVENATHYLPPIIYSV